MYMLLKNIILAFLLFLITVKLYSEKLFISSFMGDIEYRQLSSNEFFPIEIGKPIPESTVLRVKGSQDMVIFNLPNGSEIQLIGISTMIFDVLSNDVDMSLFRLLSGKAFVKIHKKSKHRSMIITDYCLSYNMAGDTDWGVEIDPLNQEGLVLAEKKSIWIMDSTDEKLVFKLKAGRYCTFAYDKSISGPIKTSNEIFKRFFPYADLRN